MGQMPARGWFRSMRILIINPNSTWAMTNKIGDCARQVMSEDTTIEAVNPPDGPAAIQGEQDGIDALPHLFELFDRMTSGGQYDAVIVACFDDTGLLELKQRSQIPVVGIGEAAFHAAALLGGKFSVVTTLSVSCPIIEANLTSYGFSKHVAGVRASEVPVLAFEDRPDQSYRALSAEIELSIKQDKIRSVVLGCAGMTDLAVKLSKQHSVPVIDGVRAAVGLVEMMDKTLPK